MFTSAFKYWSITWTCNPNQKYGLWNQNRAHLVEYLCNLIRQNNLETLPILSTDDLEICVRRANRRMPPRPYNIKSSYYHDELAQVERDRWLVDAFFTVFHKALCVDFFA